MRLSHDTNLPASGRVWREIKFVRPGAVTGFAAAVYIQGDPVDKISVESPLMINTLIQSSRCVNGSVGVKAVAQLVDTDFFQLVLRCTILVIDFRGNRNFRQPQGCWRNPRPRRHADATRHSDQ